MQKRLSRLEREYVLSSFLEFPPELEIFNSGSDGKTSAGGGPSGSGQKRVVCPPSSYTYESKSQRVFFRKASWACDGMWRMRPGDSCAVLFGYKAKNLMFPSKIVRVGGGICCPVGELFYVDEEGEADFVVTADVHFAFAEVFARHSPAFPLNTGDAAARAASFWDAVFVRGERVVPEKSPVLVYVDHECALVAFSAELFREILSKAGGIREASRSYDTMLSVRFEKRTITAFGSAVFLSAGRRGERPPVSSLPALCKIQFNRIAQEDIRFLYEMTRGKKYVGPP